ncbi:MAG: hypothetical protein EXQ56_02625 [Acidobacteria bacterium]|nr:hypothetical protein [Acidobacteriota bacterium]
MQLTSQRGFTMGEVLLVTSLFTFVSTGVMTLVHKKNGSRSTNEEIYRQMVLDGRETVDQIAAEVRLAGSPALPVDGSDATLDFTNSNRVAARAFLLATGEQIVFEADVDNNGSVERIEYRLQGENLQRSAVTKNADGSVPASIYETIAERVDNGGLPVFTFDGDLTGELPVAPDPQMVRVMLLLRSPVRDRKAGRNRTVGFEAVAQRDVVTPGRIEASTPEEPASDPANVAAEESSAPASEPTAKNHIPNAAPGLGIFYQNLQDSRPWPNYKLSESPVIWPAYSAHPAASDDSDGTARLEPFHARLLIATTAGATDTGR